MNVNVLVGFGHHSVPDARAVAPGLGPRLWGVRLDTSEDLIDRSLAGKHPASERELSGVTAELVRLVRERLDQAGFSDLRIVGAGGFDDERSARFEAEGVPVDAYGVGSALLRGSIDFTADVVVVDGRPSAKAGRGEWPNARLEPVR